MIGQLLAGRYRVLQVLGAGGFGQTYITEDLHLPGQPKCVLKHLKPATNRADVLVLARQLFQKEAETLQQLGNHDRIPRLLAYFEEGQEFYLVQEFIAGHTLAYELISDQKWTEVAVRRFLQEVLEILQFVHSQGVIHRDIKPENLMRRDGDGKLILIDFGAIKQVRNQQFTQMGTAQQTVAIGTLGYMAPEQARGNPRPSSDIYALGVIGIQALTGRYPTEFLEDEQTGELQWQHFTNANPALVALLYKMTRYHFRDRYPNASAVLQDLQAQAPVPVTSGNLPTTPMPPSYNLSTAPTQVVAPARPVPPAAQPAPKSRPLTDPRLEPPQPKGGVPWLLWLSVLGSSGAAGYFLLPKVMPSNLLNSFDQRVAGDLCRLASPTTKDNLTKVRPKPDRDAAIATTIPKGEKLLELSRQDVFVQVERKDGSKGWVFNNQIDSCRGVSIKPSDSPKPSATRSDAPLERRSTPSPSPKPPTSNSSPSPTISPSATSSPSLAPTASAPSPTATPTLSPIAPSPSPTSSPSTVSPAPSTVLPTTPTATPVSPSTP
jgi:serine/threonine protein kinase